MANIIQQERIDHLHLKGNANGNSAPLWIGWMEMTSNKWGGGAIQKRMQTKETLMQDVKQGKPRLFEQFVE